MTDVDIVKLQNLLNNEHKNLKYLVSKLDDELARFSHVEDKIDVCEVITRCNQIILYANTLRDEMRIHAPEDFDIDDIGNTIKFEDEDEYIPHDELEEEYDPWRENPIEVSREPFDPFKYQ